MITKPQKKELDRLRPIAVKNIYPICPFTKEVATDDHHIFGRGLSVRWNLLNSVGVVRWFHSMEKSTSQKERDHFHARVKEWFINKFSEEVYNEMELLSKETAHNLDYDEIKNNLIKYVR